MITPTPNQPVLMHYSNDIVSISPSRVKTNSPSPPPTAPTTDIGAGNKLSICFDGGSQMILRPNRILRGNNKKPQLLRTKNNHKYNRHRKNKS